MAGTETKERVPAGSGGGWLAGLVARRAELAPEEARRAVVALGVVFAASLALATMKAAQSGVFLASCDRGLIPWAFAASAATLALASSAVVALAPRMPGARLTRRCLEVSSLVLLALFGAVEAHVPYAAFVLYVAIEALSGVLVVQVWAVVGAAADVRTGKRLLPLAGLASGLGWSAMGALLPPLARATSAEALVVLAALLLGGAAWLAGEAARNEPPRAVRATQGLGASFREGFVFVATDPLLRLLAALAVLGLVLEQLMDYALLVAARETLGDAESIASFFAAYYGATSVVGMAMLGTAAARLLGRLGATRSLALLPASVTVLSLAAALLPGLASITLFRGVARVLKQSVWSSSVEQLQSPLPPVRRTQARQATRGVIAPLGYGLAALALAAVPEHAGLAFLPLATSAVAALTTFVVVRRVGPPYLAALTAAIDQRRLLLGAGRVRASSTLDADACALLERIVVSGDEERATTAATVLGASASPGAWSGLLAALDHPSPHVRTAAVEGLDRLDREASANALARTATSDPASDVRRAALDRLEARSEVPSDVLDRLAACPAGDPLSAEIAVVIARAALHGEARGRALAPAIASPDPHVALRALDALDEESACAPGVASAVAMRLADAAPALRIAAAEAVVRAAMLPLIPDVVLLLRDPRVAPEVARVLAFLSPPSPGPSRSEPLSPMPSSLTRLASRIAKGGGAPAIDAMVRSLIAHPDRGIRRQAVKALTEAISHGLRPPFTASEVREQLAREAGTAHRLAAARFALETEGARVSLGPDDDGAFLAHELELAYARSQRDVLRALGLLGTTGLVRAIEAGRRLPDASRDAQIAELLEHALPTELAPLVVPLFDRISLASRVERGREAGLLPAELRDAFRSIAAIDDASLRGIALAIDRSRFTTTGGIVRAEDEAAARLAPLARALRQVPSLHDLPAEDLFHLAAASEVRQVAAGERLAGREEPPGAFFVFLEGRALVGTEPTGAAVQAELEVLAKGTLGADLASADPGRVLVVPAPALDDLLARSPEATRALLGSLAGRLRSAASRA